jgi:hypothetical protein
LDQCCLLLLVVVEALLAKQSKVSLLVALDWWQVATLVEKNDVHSVLVVLTQSTQPILLVLDGPLLSIGSTNLCSSNVVGIFHACLPGLSCALRPTNVCICISNFCISIPVGRDVKGIRSTTYSLSNLDPCMSFEDLCVVAVVVGSLAVQPNGD